jgi:L-ribulokinase
MTLHTTPGEIYRSLIESTAFGARVIIERYEEYGVRIDRVVNCGGIAVKSPLAMQIYADVINRPMEVSRSEQTCALGAAIAGAVAGKAHGDFAAASDAMTAVRAERFVPNTARAAVYERLFALYIQIHDAFGKPSASGDLSGVMKQLLVIRDEVRK